MRWWSTKSFLAAFFFFFFPLSAWFTQCLLVLIFLVYNKKKAYLILWKHFNFLKNFLSTILLSMTQVLASWNSPKPSFNLRMDAELGVKNANFRNYKFQFRDAPVGEAFVRKTKAWWLSTKKLEIEVDLSSNGLPTNSQLVYDLNSEVLKLKSRSRLNGKV